MAHLIDKERVVSLIKERRDAAISRQKNLEKIGDKSVLNEMVAFNLDKILETIDSLETKEIIDCNDATLDFEEYGIDPDSQYAKVIVEIINSAIYNSLIKEKSYDTRRKRIIIERPQCKVALWSDLPLENRK